MPMNIKQGLCWGLFRDRGRGCEKVLQGCLREVRRASPGKGLGLRWGDEQEGNANTGLRSPRVENSILQKQERGEAGGPTKHGWQHGDVRGGYDEEKRAVCRLFSMGLCGQGAILTGKKWGPGVLFCLLWVAPTS